MASRSSQARADGWDTQALLALLGDAASAPATRVLAQSSQAPGTAGIKELGGVLQAGVLRASASEDGLAGVLCGQQAGGLCASQLLQLACGAETHDIFCSHAGNQHASQAQGDHSELGHRCSVDEVGGD